MPNPHCKITIVQRSKHQSAVAGAAYQSGSRLFSEYDQTYKDFTRKQGILYSEIMLPSNAPPEYADREKLWNAAEEIEKQWNSQLARRLILALPREVPKENYPQMVRDYCSEFFVSKGMCCDFAIHDPSPPGHNPHCHVMLTMRAMDEKGKWLPKSRKVYDLDENGERIRLPSGRWKCHKENTVDWNEQSHGEEWRHGWEVTQNRYLEMAGSTERADLRSYERQGIDKIPTVHMGPSAMEMEHRGIRTNIGNLNRDIRSANRFLDDARSSIKDLQEQIGAIIAAREKAAANLKPASPNLADLLNRYMNLKKEGQDKWSRQERPANDPKNISNALAYLKKNGLVTLEDLDGRMQKAYDRAEEISADLEKAEHRMQEISDIWDAASACRTHKAVHDQYVKIKWRSRQEAFGERHRDELSEYNKAYSCLRKHGVGPNVDRKALKEEYAALKKSQKELSQQLDEVKKELKPLKQIRYWVERVPMPYTAAERKPEQRHSVMERLKYLQERKQHETERRNEPARKHDMEI